MTLRDDGQVSLFRDQFFKIKLCPYQAKGKCTRGELCTYAHSAEELQPLIPLYKTKMCHQMQETGHCRDGPNCKFAHHAGELRFTSDYYKTSLCRFWMRGHCPGGLECRHAHGIHEIRKRNYRHTELEKKAKRDGVPLETLIVSARRKRRDGTEGSVEGVSSGGATPIGSSQGRLRDEETLSDVPFTNSSASSILHLPDVLAQSPRAPLPFQHNAVNIATAGSRAVPPKGRHTYPSSGQAAPGHTHMTHGAAPPMATHQQQQPFASPLQPQPQQPPSSAGVLGTTPNGTSASSGRPPPFHGHGGHDYRPNVQTVSRAANPLPLPGENTFARQGTGQSLWSAWRPGGTIWQDQGQGERWGGVASPSPAIGPSSSGLGSGTGDGLLSGPPRSSQAASSKPLPPHPHQQQQQQLRSSQQPPPPPPAAGDLTATTRTNSADSSALLPLPSPRSTGGVARKAGQHQQQADIWKTPKRGRAAGEDDRREVDSGWNPLLGRRHDVAKLPVFGDAAAGPGILGASPAADQRLSTPSSSLFGQHPSQAPPPSQPSHNGNEAYRNTAEAPPSSSSGLLAIPSFPNSSGNTANGSSSGHANRGQGDSGKAMESTAEGRQQNGSFPDYPGATLMWGAGGTTNTSTERRDGAGTGSTHSLFSFGPFYEPWKGGVSPSPSAAPTRRHDRPADLVEEVKSTPARSNEPSAAGVVASTPQYSLSVDLYEPPQLQQHQTASPHWNHHQQQQQQQPHQGQPHTSSPHWTQQQQQDLQQPPPPPPAAVASPNPTSDRLDGYTRDSPNLPSFMRQPASPLEDKMMVGGMPVATSREPERGQGDSDGSGLLPSPGSRHQYQQQGVGVGVGGSYGGMSIVHQNKPQESSPQPATGGAYVSSAYPYRYPQALNGMMQSASQDELSSPHLTSGPRPPAALERQQSPLTFYPSPYRAPSTHDAPPPHQQQQHQQMQMHGPPDPRDVPQHVFSSPYGMAQDAPMQHSTRPKAPALYPSAAADGWQQQHAQPQGPEKAIEAADNKMLTSGEWSTASSFFNPSPHQLLSIAETGEVTGSNALANLQHSTPLANRFNFSPAPPMHPGRDRADHEYALAASQTDLSHLSGEAGGALPQGLIDMPSRGVSGGQQQQQQHGPTIPPVASLFKPEDLMHIQEEPYTD
ncbi:unnamed protein product [Vitrella brassicaformis CCMP3155]|uniref:C3H1-type domain-containing protein n=3 Tax=Vitrella brassicaformis TaxID=1169539 RepID=A0A0G4FXD5_VITBC|nr:unnamed protein product [Vitrella brassicaformis CCMP3155]|eukprot:CEM20067.1 unnamed protein product [Vitrella brassicaformis CCMP3155]